MKYNLLNPREEQQFKQSLTTKGYSADEIDSIVADKKGTGDLATQAKNLSNQASIMKSTKEINDLSSGVEDLGAAAKEKQRFAKLSRNTLGSMKSIYGMGDAANVGTGKDLSGGEGVLGKLNRFREDAIAGVTGISNKKRDSAKEFNDLAQMLVGQLSQAFGSGTPQEGEAQRLIKSMPTRSSNDATAKAWFSNVDNLLAQSAGEQSPNDFVGGGDLASPDEFIQGTAEKTAPIFNVKGQIAQPGDLVISSSGKQERYQAPTTTFKENKSTGAVIDNALLNFLADSWLVPAAGSVIGAMAGAGAFSILTGAAGAVAGKSVQQWAKEMRDPDAQDISDHMRVVVIEGVTDAVLGGLTMGVGKIAGKGIGMILGKAGTEIAEEGVEQGIKGVGKVALESGEQAGESGVVSALKNRTKGLVRRASGVTITEEKEFARATGGSFVQDLIDRGIPKNAAEQIASGEAGLREATDRLTTLLEGKTIPKESLLTALKESKESFMMNGEVIPAARGGVAEIEKNIAFINSAFANADEVPAPDVQTIKQALQQSFGSVSSKTKMDDKLVQAGSRKVRELLEELDPTIKGTNREIIFNRLLSDSGVTALKRGENAKAVLSLTDWVALGPAAAAGPLGIGALGIKKAIETVSSDPYNQARIIASMVDMASQKGDKRALRGILSAATQLKIPFSIDPKIMAKAGKATIEAGQAGVSQSLLQQPQQNDNQSPQDFIQQGGVSSPDQFVQQAPAF